MILSFSEDEEEVCQRMLQIISRKPLLGKDVCASSGKTPSMEKTKLNIAEKNVVMTWCGGYAYQ